MSMPLGQQPPPVAVIPPKYLSTFSPTHSSIGPFIGVLVIIIILGILAVVVGRLCSGRTIMGRGHGRYDIESWAETKCSSCIDGRINHPPPRPDVHAEQSAASVPTQSHQESKEVEQSPQQPPANLHS